MRLFVSVPPCCCVPIKCISSVTVNITQGVVGFAFFGHSGRLTEVHDIRQCRYIPIWKDKTLTCSLWFGIYPHTRLSEICLISNARGSCCLVGFCFASKERQFLPIFSLSIAFFFSPLEFFNLQGVFECVNFVTSSTNGIIVSLSSSNTHVFYVLWRVQFSLSTS